MQLCFNQFSMLIFSKVQPIFKAHRKVKSYIFSLVLFFSPTMHACVPSFKKYINILLISISFSTSLLLLNETRGSFQRRSNTFIFFQNKGLLVTSINLKGWSGQSKYCLKRSIRVVSTGKLDFLMLYFLLLEKISS